MPKPTLTIGGTITAAEARQLAELLAKEWCPPVAVEEGDSAPSAWLAADENDDPVAFYLAKITACAQEAEPFRIGFWEREDSPREWMIRSGLDKWLAERRDRLAWRSYVPAHHSHGDYYDGSILVEGAVARGQGFIRLNSDDQPVVEVDPIEEDKDEDALVEAARATRAIFDFHPPALVIEG